MLPSLQIAKAFGIPIRLHWSFGLLLLFVLISAFNAAGRVPQAQVTAAVQVELGNSIGLLVIVFTIVVLHELGHALAARHYGIPTAQILLTPLGGIASLKRMPSTGWREVVVAAAGPAVNLVMIAALAPIWVDMLPEIVASLRPGEFPLPLQPMHPIEGAALTSLQRIAWNAAVFNFLLAAFNLLPAFPLDGGRIFRGAIHAISGDRPKATCVAVTIGRVMAGAFVIVGLFGLPGVLEGGSIMLVMIAVFVWIAGTQELAYAKYEQAMKQPRPIAAGGLNALRMLAQMAQAQAQARARQQQPQQPPHHGVPPDHGGAPGGQYVYDPRTGQVLQTPDYDRGDAQGVGDGPPGPSGGGPEVRGDVNASFEYGGQQILPPGKGKGE